MELKKNILSVSLMLEVLGVTGTVTIHPHTIRPVTRCFSLFGGVDSSPEMMNLWVSEVLLCCALRGAVSQTESTSSQAESKSTSESPEHVTFIRTEHPLAAKGNTWSVSSAAVKTHSW